MDPHPNSMDPKHCLYCLGERRINVIRDIHTVLEKQLGNQT